MTKNIDRLIEVMARLRDPKGGCPWDLEQDFRSIAPYTLEETYEVVEAIEAGDPAAIKDELGDLLFQVVFHAQMGREAGLFDLEAIAGHVADKMIERHPHVFGDRNAETAEAVLANWEADKAKKREARARAENRAPSVLDGVSSALPAAAHAVKLQNRAARVGFDWTDARDILAKIKEEIGELEHEIGRNSGKDGNQAAVEDELGDVFFALANLARRLDIDPEQALRGTNRKFERRFREIERRLKAEGRTIGQASLEEMERLWGEIKNEEKLKKVG
ncbi:MAG TPA: nucleoside triphosphate pyrophosphohydrolase [Alphaproteobacteria bacterium]|nr:nucleoside triphosphate pyrophosphohydrolase [Alphaproteobacteria bacterium]